ncbi:DUF2242 domain-containing protein [Noviherbaspirillum sp. UKPF54]|uniref:DUF2242 domain-containing protein n=1 Tax=Noviherbaspirillum sp. UKPF54 TaxID=2601898 RepID=UPI0011B103D9|nr:DUF2242 domain-containing protein [Noviherbaspirillum sp. UKPF54]QDZ29417.1 DUF2242 domain-containing protein [Noviherbaspirillum sp. UKPF54]
MRQFFLRSSALCMVLMGLLSGCATSKKASVYQHEEFNTVDTFSRTYHASAAATCEAARRTLLSQGYVISKRQPEQVDGYKNFQPSMDVHVVIEFHVVCAPDGENGADATAFVNAVQDKYVVKKQSNSASLGVSALGSLSLPFGSSEDSLAKVGSETIPTVQFYDRFFALVDHYLAEAAASAPGDSGGKEPAQ